MLQADILTIIECLHLNNVHTWYQSTVHYQVKTSQSSLVQDLFSLGVVEWKWLQEVTACRPFNTLLHEFIADKSRMKISR